MKKQVNDIFTGKDCETHDIARWSWAFSLFGILAATAANFLHDHEIDLVALGTAIGAVVGAHGAAMWAKRDTEPGGNP